MEISIRKRSDVQIIQLRGAVRLGAGVDSFRRAIDDAFAGGDWKVVINCAEVPMIDSSGVGVIMKALSASKQHGGDVRLVNPGKFVTQTLRLLGVLNLFTIFEDEDQAVGSFAA